MARSFLLPILFLAAMAQTAAAGGEPRRVVALAPSLVEIVFAIGQGGKLVGATMYSDYPAKARSLPRVGSYNRPDVERIMALRPDLCLAVTDGTPLGVAHRLESLGVPVLAVDVGSVAGLLQGIEEVGRKLGDDEGGRLLSWSMRRRIAAVASKADNVKHKPSVLYQIASQPLIAAGKGSLLDELITLAGGRNAVEARGYPRLSVERTLALAPEVILVTGMSGSSAAEPYVQAWRRWPNIPAVRNGRVYAVDPDVFDRPGPRVVDALERLARLLHPELFPKTQ